MRSASRFSRRNCSCSAVNCSGCPLERWASCPLRAIASAPGMVPAQLVRIEGALPVTINGKRDTDALPLVDFSGDKTEYAAPRSRLEARLCQMWSRLLPGAAIGVHDDFFLRGGDSILALQ